MAKIDVRKIKKIAKDRNTIQDEVAATYTVFEKLGQKHKHKKCYPTYDC